MEDMVEQLCEKYTNLSKEEIGTIRMMANMLQPLSNLEDADIFIDCPLGDGDAIVVAEAKPSGVPSSYQNSVVGMLAKQENEPAVARTFKLGIPTKQMKALTQESMSVIQSVEPIKNGSKVIGVLIREKRLDDQYATSEKLHLSKSRFETVAHALTHMVDEENWLTECIEEALLLVNQEGYVVFRNTIAKELYQDVGYCEDVLGQKYDNICLTELDQIKKDGNNSFIETKVGKYTLSIRHIHLKKEEIAFAVIIRDITWMKEQEKELILKSVAIKEMHHRVKNNLQTIASLIRLQIRRSESEETKKVLEETMNRILAIAATHQLLAQSGVDEVSIGEVITNIKNNTVRYFAKPHFDITVTLQGDDFLVDSDVATSVALVINELLQNSLKYAFEEKEKGNIWITVKKGPLYSKIEVIDNGCGFDIENRKKDRLGLNIVKTLVKDKLHGSLELKSDTTGTKAIFDFLT